MFVKAGEYLINTDNITHVQFEEDGGIVVFFVGGQMIRLDASQAKEFHAAVGREGRY